MHRPEVRIRTWVRGTDEEIRTGLLGYLSVFYGGLVLDGITLRRTATGRLALSFPARTDRHGQRHAYIAPVDDSALQHIERVILKGLAENPQGVVP